MHLLSFIFILTLPFESFAQYGAWEKSTPSSDGVYKYYVGRSAPVSSDALAVELADRNARETALRDNFDSYFKLETVVTSDLDETSSRTNIQEKSQVVNLRGLEKIEDKLEIVGSREKLYVRYILYRYKISDIEKEKAQLQNLSSTNVPKFNTHGTLDNCSTDTLSTLVVTSTPDKATVIIDGETKGITPLKIYCELTVGKSVTIHLENSKFETYIERILVAQGSTITVNAVLKPAKSSVYIDSEPSGAEIIVKGRSLGSTPKSIELEAGIEHKLILTHPETEDVAREIRLEKDSPNNRQKFNLPLKIAYLKVISNPSNSKVLLNGQNIGSTPTAFVECPPGKNTITLNKDGYKNVERSITCSPGQKTLISDIELTPWQGPTKIMDFYYALMTSPIDNIDIQTSLFGINYSNRMFKYIGYNLGAALASGQKEFENSIIKSSGIYLQTGLPIYLFANYGNDTWIELRPEAGILTQVYTEEDSFGSTIAQESTQLNFYGASLGYSSGAFNIRLGTKSFSDKGKFKGKSAQSLSVGFQWSW